jgi:hypothetical protein
MFLIVFLLTLVLGQVQIPLPTPNGVTVPCARLNACLQTANRKVSECQTQVTLNSHQ